MTDNYNQKSGRPPIGRGANPGGGRFRTRSRTPLQPHTMNTIQTEKRARMNVLSPGDGNTLNAFENPMSKTIEAGDIT